MSVKLKKYIAKFFAYMMFLLFIVFVILLS